MADLTDDDYRAIARSARTYFASFNARAKEWHVKSHRDAGYHAYSSVSEVDASTDALNGRAAVAEYERRRK
jgi:hypothetical protein